MTDWMEASLSAFKLMIQILYNVILVICQLGCFDLELVSCPDWWGAAAATYWPNNLVELFKSKPTQSSCQITRITLSAMLRAFFSLYCLVKNTLPPKVFFKFFKEQLLFFYGQFAGL